MRNCKLTEHGNLRSCIHGGCYAGFFFVDPTFIGRRQKTVEHNNTGIHKLPCECIMTTWLLNDQIAQLDCLVLCCHTCPSHQTVLIFSGYSHCRGQEIKVSMESIKVSITSSVALRNASSLMPKSCEHLKLDSDQLTLNVVQLTLN